MDDKFQVAFISFLSVNQYFSGFRSNLSPFGRTGQSKFSPLSVTNFVVLIFIVDPSVPAWRKHHRDQATNSPMQCTHAQGSIYVNNGLKSQCKFRHMTTQYWTENWTREPTNMRAYVWTDGRTDGWINPFQQCMRVCFQFYLAVIREFRKSRLRRKRECSETKDLIRKTIAEHVCFKSLYTF